MHTWFKNYVYTHNIIILLLLMCSPVKDSVVVNDRWGNADHCTHGGFYTCHDRFNPGEYICTWSLHVNCIIMIISGKLFPHKYENAMTVQKTSWGYIRNTDISGYLTIEELLYELVSTVRYVCIRTCMCITCTNGCMFARDTGHYNILLC